MNPRLIRAAIAFYPPDWRRRYGGELEQLIADACGASASRAKAAWVIAGVAACGIRERVPKRIVSNAPRIAGALATVAAAALVVFVVTGGDRGGTKGINAPPTPITLAPGSHLGPAIRETYSSSLRHAPGAQQTLLSVDPASGNVIAASGAPVHIKIDPNTKQVLSVTRKSS